MQAIILAAGMGKRLKELTQNNTKCMVKVNGVTMIERMLKQIDKKHFSKIVIVVGYEGKKLMDFISTLGIGTPILFINNNVYYKTNNIYSLALAKEYLSKEDTILFESDIIFEDSVLDSLVDDSRDSLALVDKYESWMDGTCIKVDDNDNIVDFISGKKFDFDESDKYYKTVNLYKFSKHFSETHYIPFLEAYQKVMGDNEYYEQVLKVITMLDNPEIVAKRLEGQKWYEIDDIQDLDIAESIFNTDEDDKVKMLQKRYGGYWRYPQLLDFCYLVNPYYPPKKLMDELKSSFDKIITQYPSGMQVNSLLAAKNFGVRQENIIVGNGAAELIKALMERLKGKVGIIRPTFEEYPNRYKEEDLVSFYPDNADYSYNCKNIMEYFDNNPIDNLIVINPDNPSGNYIPKADMLKLVEWTRINNIKFIVDESFVDFADEEDNTLVDTALMEDNPHLYIMKSISKSYGVPGLRLGILASGDVETISAMKKDVAIWNINSFAEFYMQIEEKYKNDYKIALDKFRMERTRFEDRLGEIKGLRIIRSQANFIMAEITSGVTAHELTKKLAVNHNILIKDLSDKIINGGRQYIRIAVKTTDENDKLMEAMKDILD